MEFILTEHPSDKDLDDILDKLKEYNYARIEKLDIRPLAVFAQDEGGCRIGGITGETHGNWLEVDYFWVEETQRGKGMGTRLLSDMETAAMGRGCKFCFLNTFGFQARDFYLKMGYQEVFTLEEYPVTGKRHYFIKQFPQNR